MGRLSLCYLHGEGIEANNALASAYSKMSAEGGDPYGMFIRAEHKLFGKIKDKNTRVAFDYAKKAQEKGNNEAKSTLATCYFHRLSIEKNLGQAIQLWPECIEEGEYSSIIRLAPWDLALM